MAKLPIRQVEHKDLNSGEIFVAEVDGKSREFWPQWRDEGAGKRMLTEDVGLLARVPNPLNASRTLTICNGIHSRGVYGAARTLTDAELREGNERYISIELRQRRVLRHPDVGQGVRGRDDHPGLQHSRRGPLPVGRGRRMIISRPAPSPGHQTGTPVNPFTEEIRQYETHNGLARRPCSPSVPA